MKKFLLTAVSLLLVLGSCQNDLEENVLSKGQNVVTATIEGQVNSRLSVSHSVSHDKTTDVFSLAWSTGDAFKVFGNDDQTAIYNYDAGNDFSLKNGDIAPATPVYAIYPAADDIYISNEDVVTMTLNATPSVENINLPMWAGAPNGTHYAFKHLAAALQFSLSDIPAGYDRLIVEASKPISGTFTATLTETAPVLKSTSTDDNDKRVTVSFEKNDNNTQNKVFYVPLPADTYESLNVSVSNGTDTKELKSWTNLTVVRGKMYYTTAVVDASSVAGVNSVLANAGEVPTTVNLTAVIVVSEDDALDIPDDAKDVTLNFGEAPTTSEITPLVINQNEGAQVDESNSELNIIMPTDATGLYAEINAPTTTATLNGGKYAKVTATTATNTLIIKSGVEITNLVINGGNVVIEEGAIVNVIDNSGNGVIIKRVISPEGLSNALNQGGNIELGNDIESDDVLANDKEIVLDGNGHTLTSNAKKAIEVYANATIKNITIEGVNRCVDTRNAVELTLENVTLIADHYTSAYGNPQPLTIGGSDGGTVVTINNSTISAEDGYGIITFVQTTLTATESTIGGYSALYVKPGSDDSSFTFTESSQLSGSTADNDVSGNSFSTIAVRANNVEVNVYDGSKITANGNYCSALSVNGVNETSTGAVVTVAGTIVGNVLAGEIEGNTISVKSEYADKLNASGYIVSEPQDGMITVTGCADIAIGNTPYDDLATAISYAQDGDVINVFANVTSSEAIVLDKNITLNGNGNTLTSTATRAINVNYEGNVIVKDLIIATTDKTERAINVIQKTANLTLENVTAEGFKYTINVATSSVGSSITINGGKFSGYAAMNITGSNTTIQANNTEFYGVNNAALDLSNGFAVIAIGDGTTDDVTENVSVTITGGKLKASSVNENAQAILQVSDASNAEVVIDAELILYNDNVFCCEDESTYKASFKSEYKDKLISQGFEVSEGVNGLVTIEKKTTSDE